MTEGVIGGGGGGGWGPHDRQNTGNKNNEEKELATGNQKGEGVVQRCKGGTVSGVHRMCPSLGS